MSPSTTLLWGEVNVFGLSASLYSRQHGGLQLPDLLKGLHALGDLRLVDDARAAGGLESGAGFVHAPEVGGAAQVLAGVLAEHPVHDQGDVAKVIDGSEAILCRGKEKGDVLIPSTSS